MEADWKDYLATAEKALQQLDHDQTATVAKILALQVGSYRIRYGNDELEVMGSFVGIDELDDKAKEVFVSGMESLLAVVRQIEMSGTEKH